MALRGHFVKELFKGRHVFIVIVVVGDVVRVIARIVAEINDYRLVELPQENHIHFSDSIAASVKLFNHVRAWNDVVADVSDSVVGDVDDEEIEQLVESSVGRDENFLD